MALERRRTETARMHTPEALERCGFLGTLAAPRREQTLKLVRQPIAMLEQAIIASQLVDQRLHGGD